ncbi:MAG TPA: efflux RND transporter periplasmic adaptor subunit [Longimicrobium sp.]
MMDRTTWRTAGALALVLALGACGSDGQAAEQPRQAEAAVTLGPENVYVVVEEEIATGPALSGSLAAEREARVNAEIGGVVQGVFAEKGQPVRAGQVLARIDAAAIRDQVLSAQSAVRSAEQQVTTAQRNVERNQTLAAAGAVAERDLETARNTLAGAQAQLANARAQLSSAQEQMGKTTVNAPISGVVSDRPVSAGSVVQMGGPLFVIVDPGSMQLEASVPAAELGQVRIGAPVRFTVTGYPGQTFTGTVQRINPAADPVTRQVPVIVSIPNAQGTLVSGLFAEGRVQAQARQGIVVPAAAVDERGVQPVVVRLNGGKAERVNVTLGVRDAETDRVEITGGVSAGDTLLVGAALGTTPGTRVTVRAAGAAPAAR